MTATWYDESERIIDMKWVFISISALQEGLTPLMWAAWQSHDTVVKSLLEKGAIPQLKDRVSSEGIVSE